jgi:predicted acylesterase/phospholipase RssA
MNDDQTENQTENADPRPPMTVTIAGGGSYAFGFALGIAEGLAREGINIARLPIVGTSGGSHAAVAIAAGLGFDDVEPIWRDYVESAGRFWVRAAPLAESLYGDVTVDNAAGVAVRVPRFKREVLWSSVVSPADIVAASSSPFPFVRPHKIGKRRYIDGGHRSNSSADIAPASELQLVIAPFASKQQGFIGRLAARQIPKETARWREATGGSTVIVTPNEELYAIKIRGMKDLGDMSIGRKVRDAAIPIGVELATSLRRDHGSVIARLNG